MLLVGGVMHKKRSVDPPGGHVSGFKVPSAEESGRDFLWRYSCRLPKPGEIGIFDRSHCEEVRVVRGAPGEPRPAEASEGGEGRGAWTRRYRKISDWEPYPDDVLAHTLMEIDPRYPTVSTQARQDLLTVKRELEDEAPDDAVAGPFAANEVKAKVKEESGATARAEAGAVPRAIQGRGGGASMPWADGRPR